MEEHRLDARVVFQGETAKKLKETVTKKYGSIKGGVNYYIRQAVNQALEKEDNKGERQDDNR